MAEPKDVVSALSGGGDYKADTGTPAGATRILQRAVVVDTLDNFSARDEKKLTVLRDTMSEDMIEILNEAPRNSLLVKITTDGESRSSDLSSDIKVLYPLFSSHFSLPCKAGEQVWAIYETDSTGGIGYWISRISSPVHVEDPNYSHHDRRDDPVSINETKDLATPEGKKIESKTRVFQMVRFG